MTVRRLVILTFSTSITKQTRPWHDNDASYKEVNMQLHVVCGFQWMKLRFGQYIQNHYFTRLASGPMVAQLYMLTGIDTIVLYAFSTRFRQ